MDELNVSFKKMQNGYRLWTYTLLLAILAGVITAILAGALCLVFFGIAVVSGILMVRTQKKFKDFYVHNIIGACVRECTFIEGISYETDKGIPGSIVADTGMIRTGTDISSNDLITGSYDGTEFAQSAVKITHTSGVGEDRSESTFFDGLWVSFELGRVPLGDLQIVSDKFRVDTQRKGFTKLSKDLLPNTAVGAKCFADTFTVYATNTEAARSAVSGGLASALMKLLEYNQRPIMLMVIGSTVHLAMAGDGTAFEPSLRKGADLNGEKERIKAQLRAVTDFIAAAVASQL